MDIFDRSLTGPGNTTKLVSLSAFSLLFSEIFHHCQSGVENAADLEEKLKQIGHSIGWRMLSLIILREKPKKRETTVIGILQFITTVCWKALFMCDIKSLQKSTTNECEFFIYELDPLPSRFVSVPKELSGRLNCANFTAGIVHGLLDAAQFPATVRAVVAPQQSNDTAKPNTNPVTIYVIEARLRRPNSGSALILLFMFLELLNDMLLYGNF